MTPRLLVLVCASALVAARLTFAPAAEVKPDPAPPAAELLKQDFKTKLPRIPPTEPADALATFTVAPGFQIEQAAAEPLVNSPVALEWDENGRLFVCEMRGYSENRDEAVSRVSMLEDTNDDGRFDKSTIFVDKLLWPTALFCYDGGLFVGDAPDVWYFKDTDGDGRADEKKHVFTGFGTSNVQGLLNCFRWGLDNRIHLATGSIGGDVRIMSGPRFDPHAKPVNCRGRDIAFDPRTYEFELTSGASQHGMCFDDQGRKFVSSNSNHIQQVMYEDRYIARNPYLTAPDARISIAADGPQAEVFRTSPVEPWRIIRTQLRVSGAVKGAIEGGGRAAGYFTGATGVTIYRGDAFPAEWKGMAVVGDVGSNLVHRKRLEPNGLEFIARRIDERAEFTSSRDIWFRPAQFANAPDGALYILDVYREVIEHPASLPPMIKQHLDLTAGRDRGRIYRVVPDGFKHRPTPKLGAATTAELVKLLAHPNSWHRETAARLLFTRQDESAIGPLRQLAAESKSPVGRMHALYALAGLAGLTEADLTPRLTDDDAGVRRQAVRLCEPVVRRAPSSPLVATLQASVNDADRGVVYQSAFTLGEIPAPSTGADPVAAALAQVVVRFGDDRWMQTAVQSSCAGRAERVLSALLTDASPEVRRRPAVATLMERLAAQTALENDREQVGRVVESLERLPADDASTALIISRGLMQGLKRPQSEIARLAAAGKLARMNDAVAQMIAAGVRTALDDQAAAKARVAAIDGLTMGKLADLRPTFGKLIDNRQPTEVQAAAVAALGKFADPAVTEILIAAWTKLSPQVKEPALEVLFARPERIDAVLDAVEAKRFAAADIPAARVQLLTRSGSDARRSRAHTLLGSQMLGRRAEVVAAYRDALQLSGDVTRGRALFQKNCNACHRTENKGTEIGPNLATIKSRGPETILTNVLDPSREVNPQFVNYMCVTDDGRTVTGLISAESATAVTFKRAEGQTDTVLRVNIEELSSTGLSIMPEGLEKQLDKQALADVIAYLMQVE